MKKSIKNKKHADHSKEVSCGRTLNLIDNINSTKKSKKAFKELSIEELINFISFPISCKKIINLK